MWPTKSSLRRDKTAPAHIALGEGPKRKLHTLTVEGVEIVTTLTMEDVERMLPTPGRRLAWARYVDGLSRNPGRISEGIGDPLHLVEKVAI
jgi:hypothetical protein